MKRNIIFLSIEETDPSMELGKAKLLRTGLNTLHQAIHPVHGIAWTDGKQVCLTSLYSVDGEPKFGDTNVIGQFEHVLGLFWGPLCCSGSPALLAVQHKKHVTVWQLQLSALEQNKLLCTQTCEMSEPFPLLSQGCVWHPKMDILAILTKRDASVLFSVRVDNRRVKAEIKGSGLIHCACWTKDGTRLVVAIGSALHSYIWNDIQKSLVACSFCPIFDVGGYICAIESTNEAQVAVATELPLDKICGLNAGIAFDLPNESEASTCRPSPVLTVDADYYLDRRRSCDSERSGHASSSGPIDLTHILAKHRKSDPSPLIHLRRRDNLTGTGQDSSHLILVTYERKVTTTRKVSIPGILVPDIIAFDPSGSTVAVASNTSNMILVYCITDSSIPNVQQIQLQKNERPKGVCFFTNKMLLFMIGRQKSNDPAFLPSSNTDKYILRLIAKELVFDEEGATPVVAKSESASQHHGIRRHSENFSKEDRLSIKDLILPGGSVIVSPSSRRKLIEEVHSSDLSPVASSVDFSDRASSASSVALENYDMDHISRMATLAVAGQASRDSSRPCSPRYEASEKLYSDATPPKNSCQSKEKNLEQLTQNMEKIFTRFADVQQCLAEIRDFTQNGKKIACSYPSAYEPQYVHITCQKQLSENVYTDERRPLLLCGGRICLRVVQELFGLTVIEMMHGPMWIVLVADADGFVPLTFKHKDELTIRSARRKSPIRPPSCADVFLPESPVSPSAEK
ncbi:WD repeat and coiled-coil-containing protein isoform X1 [Carassius auratus]|uniref:WD repeat and coiled-coil-containing protein n=1 Tax=Carassius auratus TaxID=7957 RepID=A0A6P6RKZ3_CARAU|nr:WD repeat and coiled-coil-containing protein isoform X1 [Carassius auratus]XP_026146093.1 WD repeat and coiled-coil-containing protein isoform X1 [Carassius auratus]XP_026146094.1 WD repeat and coiled-coil-containing protein isoform X1 [Carassius auratus]XP_052443193.1 WD repeat and coiled-coil-containing protein [Carassius gibelio]